MPNWCNNYAVLTGAKEDIEKLVNALTRKVRIDDDVSEFWWAPLVSSDEDNLLENRLLFARALKYEDLGCPKKMEEFGYWDCVTYIGTKWDPDFDLNVLNPDEVTLSFDSAWSPPLRAMVILANKYNLDVEIEYDEPGCDFGGTLTYSANDKQIYTVQTHYLHWTWLVHGHDEVEAFLEAECYHLDPEDRENLREEIKSWSREDLNEMREGPVTYESFVNGYVVDASCR